MLKELSIRLKENSYKLEALNPVNVLLRGYSVAKHNGKVIKAKSDVSSGDDVTLTVSDGNIECIVK